MGGALKGVFHMGMIGSHVRAIVGALGAILVVIAAATAAGAIESEGEMFTRDRLVGNLGIAHADVGVYPDRAANNAAPDQSSGSDSLEIPAGAEIVDAVVYWAGRGPGWSDDEIIVNGTSITADIDYHWTGPSWDQTTYVADLDEAGVTFDVGTNTIDIAGMDQGGERFYGAGVIVIYEHPSLPEVELEVLEGNEFAFFRDTYSDDIGNSAEHTSVSCIEFAPAIEDRSITSFSRIMGVDAGRADGPPRTQRLQWWTGSDAVTAPVLDGIVGIPAATPQGSVDNPVTPKVLNTESWGSDVYETDTPSLAAGDSQFCTQLQSVSIGDGAGASLSLTNQGGSAETVHRLGNLVWFDVDDNGMADAGEPGIDGVTVHLFKDGGTDPIATTVTSDDGAYIFEGLLCGTYTVGIPTGQDGWTINGEEIDAAAIAPGSINNPDANDDSDNDNNGVVGADIVMSGEVEIGDCGEDGDFSNSASNEPTNEVDRTGGPDDDADEVSVADGNYDDVRSNVSIDFSYVGDIDVETDTTPDCSPDANGDLPADAVDANGDPCNPCDADNPAQDAVGPDGEPCNDCNTTNPGPDAVDANGDPCNPCDADNPAENAVGPDGEPCNDEVTVEVEGQVECPAGTDKAGQVVQPGESCDDICDADGNVVTPGTTGATNAQCQDTDLPDSVSIENDGDDDEVTVEVEGQIEENPDVAQQPAEQPLAVTGSTTMLWVYGGLMVLVLGAWFAIAGTWMRPADSKD